GRIKVGRVPAAQYQAEITVAPSDLGLSLAGGQLHGRRAFSAGAAGQVQLPIRLVETIRLTRPPPGDVTSPLAIAWEPVPGTTRYEASLVPDDDTAAASGLDLHAVVAVPEWRVEAPTGAWSIRLRAIGDHDELL